MQISIPNAFWTNSPVRESREDLRFVNLWVRTTQSAFGMDINDLFYRPTEVSESSSFFSFLSFLSFHIDLIAYMYVILSSLLIIMFFLFLICLTQFIVSRRARGRLLGDNTSNHIRLSCLDSASFSLLFLDPKQKAKTSCERGQNSRRSFGP